jgi:hypothetical protein
VLCSRSAAAGRRSDYTVAVQLVVHASSLIRTARAERERKATGIRAYVDHVCVRDLQLADAEVKKFSQGL